MHYDTLINKDCTAYIHECNQVPLIQSSAKTKGEKAEELQTFPVNQIGIEFKDVIKM